MRSMLLYGISSGSLIHCWNKNVGLLQSPRKTISATEDGVSHSHSERYIVYDIANCPCLHFNRTYKVISVQSMAIRHLS
jgi:hypothetical protein